MKRIEELKDIIKGKKNEETPKAPERELPAPGKMSMPLSDVFMRRRSVTKIWCESCGQPTA